VSSALDPAAPVADSLEAYNRPLTPADFSWVRDFLYARTGIVLKDGKQALVTGRLARRLRHHGCASYAEYFKLLSFPGSAEAAVAIDLLTTNETYFFREPNHFDFLREVIGQGLITSRPVRVWSAASSSGEEAYSIAMTLDQALDGRPWEVLGTDISSRVLERARQAIYPLDAAGKIPQPLLHRYCLKGKDDYDGYLAVSSTLTGRVSFKPANLIEPLPDLGRFDLIFLRNVMIYFDMETKEPLVRRVRALLEPGGYLMVSHSETLNGIQADLRMVRPSIYQAPS
jgi:chemotaxis protein methyltransferase CheR